MDFGSAIATLKSGGRVSRKGWNGKDMWLYLRTEHELPPGWLPYIAMVTVSGHRVPWLASQTDVLAEDWFLVG